LQRLQIQGAITPSKAKFPSSRSLPADVLCMVSVKNREQDGQDFTLTTQVVLLQAYGTSRHEIRTLQASVTGDPARGRRPFKLPRLCKSPNSHRVRHAAVGH